MDAKIKVTCPQCKNSGMAPASLAGQKVKCKSCGATVAIPRPAAAPPPSQAQQPQRAPAQSPPGQPRPPSPGAPPLAQPPLMQPPQPPGSARPSPVSPSQQGAVPVIPPPPGPSQAPIAPATPIAPVAPQAAPPKPAGDEQPTLATQELAGQICPGCQKQIFLGDEVIRCSRCNIPSHLPCWKKNEGCVSEICVPPAAAPPYAVEPEMAEGTIPCPVCAEPIPEAANVCPYCAEPLMGGYGGGASPMMSALPTTFQTISGKKWSFTIKGDELVGQSIRSGEQIQVRRSEGHRLSVTDKQLIVRSGDRQQKFKLETMGLAAVEYWLSGQVRKRTSPLATEALITAIVGIFCCQIILGPIALKKATEAQQEIELNPEYVEGEGIVVAAKVIGVIDIILFVLGFIGRMSQLGSM